MPPGSETSQTRPECLASELSLPSDMAERESFAPAPRYCCGLCANSQEGSSSPGDPCPCPPAWPRGPVDPVPCSPGCLHSGFPAGEAPKSRPAAWPWRRGRPRCGVLPWALEGVRGGEGCGTTGLQGGGGDPLGRAGAPGSRIPGAGLRGGGKGPPCSPASPTKTSCGGLRGPSPTALYTLIRISYLRCLFRSVGDSGGGERQEVTVPAGDRASVEDGGWDDAILVPMRRFRKEQEEGGAAGGSTCPLGIGTQMTWVGFLAKGDHAAHFRG